MKPASRLTAPERDERLLDREPAGTDVCDSIESLTDRFIDRLPTFSEQVEAGNRSPSEHAEEPGLGGAPPAEASRVLVHDLADIGPGRVDASTIVDLDCNRLFVGFISREVGRDSGVHLVVGPMPHASENVGSER